MNNYSFTRCYPKITEILESIVRKVNSPVHRIVIFSNLLDAPQLVKTFRATGPWSKSSDYKEKNVQSKKRKADVIRQHSSVIRHGCHVVSQCPKQKYFPPVLVIIFNISGGSLPLFRALARNMAAVRSTSCAVTNILRFFLPTWGQLFKAGLALTLG